MERRDTVRADEQRQKGPVDCGSGACRGRQTGEVITEDERQSRWDSDEQCEGRHGFRGLEPFEDEVCGLSTNRELR